jgi:MerR family transcriptional regulator, thiopeptide resistance regulator
MKAPRLYQVKELARLAHVSVRTLHHYDEIGLLVPSQRSPAGYRQYDDDDLLRLQQILIQRELGLPLEEIRRALDDPQFDRRRALLAQREQLEQRSRQTAEMLRAVDRALTLLEQREHDQKGQEPTMDRRELFDGFDPAKYEAEARQRWGHTDAYKESARRTQGYTPEDWKRLGAEQAALYGDAFALLRAGEPPDGDRARAVAERHRLSIDRWFYPCSLELHRALAGGYESDARFAANIDKYGAGLTTFLIAAIRANADRTGEETGRSG